MRQINVLQVYEEIQEKSGRLWVILYTLNDIVSFL